jgi:hypothetical protein
LNALQNKWSLRSLLKSCENFELLWTAQRTMQEQGAGALFTFQSLQSLCISRNPLRPFLSSVALPPRALER